MSTGVRSQDSDCVMAVPRAELACHGKAQHERIPCGIETAMQGMLRSCCARISQRSCALEQRSICRRANKSIMASAVALEERAVYGLAEGGNAGPTDVDAALWLRNAPRGERLIIIHMQSSTHRQFVDFACSAAGRADSGTQVLMVIQTRHGKCAPWNFICLTVVQTCAGLVPCSASFQMGMEHKRAHPLL